MNTFRLQIYKNQSGYMVLIVAVIAGLLSLIISATILAVQSTSESGDLILKKQKLSYMVEGVTQIASKFAQDCLDQNPLLTSAQLNTCVETSMTGLNISPFTLQLLNLTLGTVVMGVPVPSGPFVGMDSYQVPIQIDVKVGDATGQTFASASKSAVLAKVALFQFSLFGDLPGATTYLAPGMPMDVEGRVHVNGDLCIGNYGQTATNLRIQKVTASGGIYNLRDTNCSSWSITVTNMTNISTDAIFSIFSLLKPGADHGCTNCDGTGLDWKVYAQTIWKGNLLDSAHQVIPLKLPLKGADSVQSGIKADLTNLNNTGSLRVILDPVLPSDPLQVAEQKLAFKADIRIVNGVWYLKNPASPTDWPGVPIWSDHPGRFKSTNEEGIEGTNPVGQDDIRDRWAVTANAWPSGSTPHGYSYYEYNTSTQSISADVSGIVSYGTLFRNATATPTWSPGQWAKNNSSEFCNAGFNCTNCSTNTPLNAISASSMQCSGGPQPGIPDFLLNATRSGFKDGNVLETSGGTAAVRSQRAKIYTMNFDVSALQTALNSTSPGELGSFFGASNFMGRPFNGVIYITKTWGGSMGGLPNGAPSDHPFQGAQADLNQSNVTHPGQQQALPFPLCSAAPSDLPGGAAGQHFAGGPGHFRVPDCAKYAATYTGADKIEARTNAVRIYNGATLDPAVFPKGLTISTNMPVYLLGDYNTSSDTSSLTASPWVPTMIAADQVILLSNKWDDKYSRWDVGINTLPRMAKSTTYNVSILAGGAATTPTAWSGGLENLPRFIEMWNNYGANAQTATIRGSLVEGFASVYFRNPIGPSNPASVWGPYTYLPPLRDYGYDPHLSKYTNQPAGTPSFDIYSVMKWSSQ